MRNYSFKAIIQVPQRSIYQSLCENLSEQDIQLFYVQDYANIERYVRRARPDTVVVYVDADPSRHRTIAALIQNCVALVENIWFVVLLEDEKDLEIFREKFGKLRIFFQVHSASHHLIAHNLLLIKEIEKKSIEAREQKRYEEGLSQCLQIVYQTPNFQDALEQLINYLPKIVSMDYWSIAILGQPEKSLDYFAQFIPPICPQKLIFLGKFQKQVERWIKKGEAFRASSFRNGELFEALQNCGWLVQQVHFLPISLKEVVVGGLVVGSLRNRLLSSPEIRFLKKINKVVSRRLLIERSTAFRTKDLNEFSDRLIAKHLDEDFIFQHTCRQLNEIADAASTIFWQYNKGFGFIFPKYFYFARDRSVKVALEKVMIFLEKDEYLSQIINIGELQTINDIAQNLQLSEATRQVFYRLNYRNLLILPLKLNKEIVGILIVNKSWTGEIFNVWEIDEAEKILEKVRNVLEEARRVKEVNLKLKQLSRLFELGSEITHDLSLKSILLKIIRNLRKTLGWNDVAVLIKDVFGKRLRVSTRLGFSQEVEWEFKLAGEIDTEKFENFLSKCERIGHSYFYNSHFNLNHDQSRLSSIMAEWQRNSLLLVPLDIRNKVQGYLLVHDPVDRLKPTIEKVIPLEYYANQAAVAVENSLLYEKLRASQERYRSLAETMSLGLVRCDTNGCIVYVNPAFCQLIGVTAEDMLSEPLKNSFAEASQEKLAEVLEKLLDKNSDEKTRLENMEFEILDYDSKPVPVSVFGFPFFEQHKKTGFFFIMNDLRVIKRLERMKSDFNSMIVHDLRSPMNVIQGFIELIRGKVVGDINEEQEELLDIAKDNTKKVLTLVDNFLIAAQLDVGKFSLDSKLNEINTLIKRQVKNHLLTSRNKNIQMEVKLDENLPLLSFDSLRIEQVLNNLLGNALKFTPESGRVYVRSRLNQTALNGDEQFYALISVQDTGVGIPEDKLPKIFEKYEQVNENQSLNIRGTGLGLSICKEIVNLHGGEIWVESQPESGSTFFFTLPIKSAIEEIIG